MALGALTVEVGAVPLLLLALPPPSPPQAASMSAAQKAGRVRVNLKLLIVISF
ncbi:hypothetical protein D3C71_2210590 [compost metagenome]